MSNIAIICVDDELAILRALRNQLHRSFGDRYIYEIAQSAEEAWVVINDLEQEEVKIMVIVSDWLMPNVKGDEFLAQVHQQFPQIIKIMLTGQADESAIDRARQDANLYACIYKPWMEEELQQVISSALKL